MKACVLYIGVVDNKNAIHAVAFTSGVNVITGKSSTGKSAVMEIFDYCFGSSEFTVPEGIITKYTEIYFSVIRIGDVHLVLGRKPGTNTAFIKEESDEGILSSKDSFRGEYFSAGKFLPIENFKKELRRYTGPRLTDVDESAQSRKHRGRKSPGPSVRSFMSFILQHQNLVANKHAIFYRFDEKEKREQTIEHFKIFAGYVDQQYFLTSQELEELKEEQRKLERQKPSVDEINEKARETLTSTLQQYAAISGASLQIGEISDVLQNPMRALESINAQRVHVYPLSDAHDRQRAEYEHIKGHLVADLRKERNKLALVKSSVEFAKNYVSDARAVSVPTEAELLKSQCPFCKQHHTSVEEAANRLEDAISWLNNELRRTPYSIESFEEDERQISKNIERIQNEIRAIDEKTSMLDKQIDDLDSHRSQHELALKVKLQIENLLETLISKNDYRLDQKLVAVKAEIDKKLTHLREKYNIEAKLDQAETTINDFMEKIGNRFDFEDSFRPVKLKFSLRTFDLWHQKEDGGKVYLRSMGSGANWLYCHLTLFLALQRYFCSLGKNCNIPSILFVDQPSQVYFPSVLDRENEFDAKRIAALAGRTAESVDEDVRAVSNLYSELVRFCRETLDTTGIEPQIIVTDHADRLFLGDGMSFESLVQGRRWRDRGFILVSENPPRGPSGTSSDASKNESDPAGPLKTN